MCDISLNGVTNSSDIYDSVTNKATFISLNDVTNSSDICDSFTNKATCISLNDVTNSSDICGSSTNKATCISLNDVTNSSDIYDSVSYKRGLSATVTSESVTKRTVRCRNTSIIALFAIVVLAVVVAIVVLVVLKQSDDATATTVSSIANATATISASTTVAISSTVTTGTTSAGPSTTTTPQAIATATTVSTSIANATSTISASTTVAVSSTVTTGTVSDGPPTTTTPPDIATATTVSTSIANATSTISASTTVAVSSTITTGTASAGPPTTTTPTDTGLHDCRDVYESGHHVTGVYLVNVNVSGQLQRQQVYCDMDTPPGGWTVFQKRFDGSVDFYRFFNEYESGFGELHGEFWLGLKWVYWMTLSRPSALFINLTQASSGDETFVRYGSFSLGSPPGYNLSVSSYSGTDDDMLFWHNGMMFSTRDHDVDNHPNQDFDCAKFRHAGYWFNMCAISNLNGKYNLSSSLSSYGFTWHNNVWLSRSQMAFRRTYH